jgi:hypothetical protein
MKLSEKILNQLQYGKTSKGMVGCKVQATGENKSNHAWIGIEMMKHYDMQTEITKEYFIAFEVEYVELDEKYNAEEDVLDYDLFLVKKERFFNIKTVEELENILRKWVEDFTIIQPIANVGHPYR